MSFLYFTAHSANIFFLQHPDTFQLLNNFHAFLDKKSVFSLFFYMKYSANQRRISRFVKIVNFVRQATAKIQIGLMAVGVGLF